MFALANADSCWKGGTREVILGCDHSSVVASKNNCYYIEHKLFTLKPHHLMIYFAYFGSGQTQSPSFGLNFPLPVPLDIADCSNEGTQRTL